MKVETHGFIMARVVLIDFETGKSCWLCMSVYCISAVVVVRVYYEF